VWLTNGTLSVTNANTFIGFVGHGQLTVSNGMTLLRNLNMAGVGTFTVAGGTNRLLLALDTAFSTVATSTVWVTGGELIVTNAFMMLPRNNVTRMSVSNATVKALQVLVGINSGTRGELTLAGGTTSVSSNMTVGKFSCDSTAIVNLVAGNLFITNTAASAVLDLRGGTFTQNGGTLTVDNLVLTNACGHFIKTVGIGTLVIKGTIALADDLDADGDGMPNKFETDNLLFVFDPADAAQDKDGDGLSNLQEFLAGTSPTNSASFFGITAIAREANNIRVTWMTAAGKTNALERTAGVAGSFTNNFAGITNIVTTGTSTNYVDIGAATNVPAFFYRVRLVP
jgi:hypothetical protein